MLLLFYFIIIFFNQTWNSLMVVLIHNELPSRPRVAKKYITRISLQYTHRYKKPRTRALEVNTFFPGVSNRWKSMIGKPIYQSIKLVNWYRLVSANRWPMDYHTKTVYRLLSIGTATSNRRHARYLSDPVFSTQRIYPVARVLELPTCPSLPFRVIMSTQEVREYKVNIRMNIRCIVKGWSSFISVCTHQLRHRWFCHPLNCY